MKELDKPYNPKIYEEKIYQTWEKSGFFSPDRLPPISADARRLKRRSTQKKPFCIVVPPPNITGSLHMGHALNAVIQDILIRYHRMRGFKTLWLPGTDHAGIATQYVVEKELKKEGKTRFDLGKKAFLELVWDWKQKYGHIILEQFKKLGASCDWSRMRFTMDPDYIAAVETAFIHYFNQGLIYQGERAINWCSRCLSSLSDLEIEYQEEPAALYYIKYGPITIATVRPETKLGDTAVAVNPKDKRYQKYIGQEIEIKSVDGKIKMKVIADESVDPGFGTGAIKVTPAHDINDFEIGQKNKLAVKSVIGPDGRMNKNAGQYAGLKIAEAREKIVTDMKKLGLIEKSESITHQIAKCYRCGTTIEPIISKQWFLKMKELAAATKKSLPKIDFVPPRWKKVLEEWLSNIKDWTISRQIWWGHQLPVWEHEPICIPKPGQEKDTAKCIGVVASSRQPKCKFCKAKYIRVSDVLDTWFSSALWPFAALGWPKQTKDLKEFYPTQVLSTDRGIINLWVARMIFSGLEFMKKEPFAKVIIHATVLTKEGARMSKSLGTGIDPLRLINEYGADATRFAIIWQAMGGQDIKWQQEAIVTGRKLLNKIWNASRFVLSRLAAHGYRLPAKLNTSQDLNKNILEKFEKTKAQVINLIEKYEFGQALHLLYDFLWHEFCDKYLEQTKKTQTDETNKTLLWVLAGVLKLFHPFIPFITEVLWTKLPIKNKKLLIVEEYE